MAISPLLISGATHGLLGLLPDDTGQPVDAIVVLGRGAGNRSERSLAAAGLWAEGRAEKIFVSGMGDAPPIMASIKDLGTTATALSGERCSQTTWENGLFTHTLLKPQGASRILLITDRPHMVRLHLVFRSFGFEVMPHPVEVEPDSAADFGQPYRLMMRELAALIVYGTRGRLQPEAPATRQQSETAAQTTLQNWGCSLKGPKDS